MTRSGLLKHTTMDFDGLKRKELQSLCKKHSIPANLTNVEMAKRLRALVTVEEKAGALKRTVLKSSNEKESENEPDFKNKQPKKVRFDLVNQMYEFEKSEVKYIDNVGSSESGNGDHRGVTRRSLRNKKVEDDRMGETEDLVDGSNKSVVEIDEEEVVEMTENAHPEKVIRRSMRNAPHVENPKLLPERASETEAVERGKSRNMITATRTNGSEAEKDVNIVAKTGLSAGENLRRSKRHASTEEPLVTLDNLDGQRTGRKEARNQIRLPVKEAKEVPSVGENLRRSKRHAVAATNAKQEAKKRRRGPNVQEERERSIKPQKEKKRSKNSQKEDETEEPSLEAKDSFPEGVAIEQSSFYIELTTPEHGLPTGGKKRSESPSGHGLPIILDGVEGDTCKNLEGSSIQRSELEEPSIEAKDSFPEGVAIEQSSFYVELTIPEQVPIGVKTRSESPAGPEPSIILDSVEGDTDKGLEGSIIKRGAFLNVQQEESAETNQTLVQEPLQLSEQSLPTGEKKRSESPSGHGLSIILDGVDGDTDKNLEGSSIQRSSETEEPSIETNDSFTEGVAIEQSSFYVELTIPEGLGEKTRSESPSGLEPSIILDSVEGDTDKGLEGSNIQRRASLNVQQEESADTNQTLIQEPFQLSVGNVYETEKAAPKLLEEIVPQEEKETKELQKMQDKSEIPKVDANSFQEELMTKKLSIIDQPTLYVQPILTENADGMVHQNPDETEIVGKNIYKPEKPGKDSSLESYCRIENSPMEVNPMKQRKHLEPVEPSESVELLNDPTHSESGTSPLDTAATEDFASMSVESNKREMVEHVGFSCSEDQAVHFSDVARLSAGGAFTKRGAFDKSELGETSEIFTDADHCTLTNHSGDIDEPEDIQIGQVLSPGEQIPEELSNVIKSGLTSVERVKSPARLTTMQRAKPPGMQRGAFDAEKIDETDRNVDEELTWDKFERIEKDKGVDDQLNSSERYQGSNVPDTSIINHSSMPKDENLGEYSSKLADLQGKSLEANHNLCGPDAKEYSGTFSENGDCCHPDYSMQNRDTEEDVTFDTKAKVEKDVCSFVVALPAFVLPPEGTIGPLEISIPDDVHAGMMMNNNDCKEGEEFSSLFATPVAISSAKEETFLYSHKGEISSDIIPVERTISMKKDEHSCPSHAVFSEAGRPETSLLDSTQDAQEDSCHSRSGQLDIQDNAFGDPEFIDDLSPRIETDLDPLCCDIIKDDPEMTVLLESGPKEYMALVGQEDDEMKQEGDVAMENTELDTRVVDPHSPICYPSVGLRESDVMFVGNISTRVDTADCVLHSDSVNGAEMLDAIETSLEKSPEINDNAGREHNESTEQEDNEEKEWVHSTVRNAKLDIQDLVELQSSIDPLYHEISMNEIEQEPGEYTDEIFSKMKIDDLNIEDLYQDFPEFEECDVADTVEVSSDLKSAENSSLRIEDAAGDTLHVDWLPEAATNQGALVEHFAVKVEETTTAADADSASQEMSSVAAKEGTTEEEKQISANIFCDQVNELKAEDLVSSELEGGDVADTCEHIHLQCNELLSPRIGNKGEQASVLASGGIDKAELERPADMVVTDAKLISETIKEFDGALEDEVDLMKCQDVVDHQETEGKVRTILIHGTPIKVQMRGDMKENMASSKLDKVGNLTTVRPAKKRTALTHQKK